MRRPAAPVRSPSSPRGSGFRRCRLAWRAGNSRCMKSPDGVTVPTWKDLGAPPEFPEPQGGRHADVIVVGAGIAGLTSAYLLAREGKSVVVLDDGPVVSGQSERTSAHLASANDDRFYEVERMHGVEASRASYEGNAAGIDLIERIAREESINCDFSRLDGYLFP